MFDEDPTTPPQLARELRVDPKVLRGWLRRTFPRSPHDKGTNWQLTPEQVRSARQHFRGRGVTAKRDLRPATAVAFTEAVRTGPRASSDEAYVISLCDELLAEAASRQHRFDWLLGDPGEDGRRVRLPVDAFYKRAAIVVEYRERQHEQAVPFFDKPDRLTVSGVHRGEQRRLYDQRREAEVPKQGLRLVIVRADDLACNARGRLYRVADRDRPVLQGLLADRP